MSLTEAMKRGIRKFDAATEPVASRRQYLEGTPDIFISYATGDHALAESLDRDLRDDGYATWWAANLIAGDASHIAITTALDRASAVIAIWTPLSIRSAWVRGEAERARVRDKLVPVCARTLRFEDVPPPFNTIHTLDLSDRVALRAALDRLGLPPRLNG